MTLFRQALFHSAALAVLAAALVAAPALAQPPGVGVYTYRYGHNPGYYGSSVRPCDTGCKPGQAIVQGHGHYRWINRTAPLPQGAPAARPLQSR